MNTERIVSVAVAVVVALSLGHSAATLESTMTTDPEDVIDLDDDAIPLGEGRGTQLQATTQQLHDQYTSRESENGEPQPGTMASDIGRGAPIESADAHEQASGNGEATTTIPTHPGLDLLSLLGIGLLGVASVGLAYRYRRQLGALVAATGGTGARTADTAYETVPAPENEVERAWVELVIRAGVSQPERHTPRECADIAVERGFDPDEVTQLRRLFEDVQYGTVAPDTDRERIASETLETLRSGR